MGEHREVDIVCEACKGTGLYRGMREGPGEAVICVRCHGSGKQTKELFDGRKIRGDVKVVRLSGGVCMFAGSPGKQTVTYEEFLNGQRPEQ